MYKAWEGVFKLRIGFNSCHRFMAVISCIPGTCAQSKPASTKINIMSFGAIPSSPGERPSEMPLVNIQPRMWDHTSITLMQHASPIKTPLLYMCIPVPLHNSWCSPVCRCRSFEPSMRDVSVGRRICGGPVPRVSTAPAIKLQLQPPLVSINYTRSYMFKFYMS